MSIFLENKIKIKIGLIAICTIAGLVILSVFVACVIRLKENKKSTRDRSANEDLSKRARAYSKSSSVISSTTDDQTTLPQRKENDCCQQEEESYFADIIIESIPESKRSCLVLLEKKLHCNEYLFHVPFNSHPFVLKMH